MSLTIVFLAAILTVASGLLFVLRFVSWGTLLRYHWLSDAIAHIVLFAVFLGLEVAIVAPERGRKVQRRRRLLVLRVALSRVGHDATLARL